MTDVNKLSASESLNRFKILLLGVILYFTQHAMSFLCTSGSRFNDFYVKNWIKNQHHLNKVLSILTAEV